MSKGERATITCPPDYAYGKEPSVRGKAIKRYHPLRQERVWQWIDSRQFDVALRRGTDRLQMRANGNAQIFIVFILKQPE